MTKFNWKWHSRSDERQKKIEARIDAALLKSHFHNRQLCWELGICSIYKGIEDLYSRESLMALKDAQDFWVQFYGWEEELRKVYYVGTVERPTE